MRLLFIFFFSIIILDSNAQSLQLSSTESTCQNNGTVTAITSGLSTPIEYTITGGSDNYTNTVSINDLTKSWQALYPGNYTVTASDGTNEITESITVAGNYTFPDAQTTIEAITCPNGDDGMISTTVAGGSAPFEYELYSGNNDLSPANLLSANNTGDFSGLSEGQYTVRVIDTDCNNESTSVVTLSNDYPGLSPILSSDETRLDCNSFLMRANTLENGSGDLSYRIISPSGYETDWQTSNEFTLSNDPYSDLPSQYTIEIRDNICSEVATITTVEDKPESSFELEQPGFACDEAYINFNGTNLINPTYTYIDPSTGQTVTTSSTPNQNLVVPGGAEWCVTVEDDCDYATPQDFCITPTTNESNFSVSTDIKIASCRLGIADVPFRFSGTHSNPVSFELTQTPVDYEGQLQFAGYYPSNTGTQRLPNEQAPFTPGDYTVVITDDCGVAYEHMFTVNPEDILIVDIEAQETPTCDNSNVSFTASYNRPYGFDRFYLYEINGDGTSTQFGSEVNGTETSTGIKEGSWNNVPPGDYYVEYRRCNSINEVVRDTITVVGQENPEIIESGAIQCDDPQNELYIYAQGFKGVPQYEYRLISGPTGTGYPSYPTAYQTDNLLGTYPIPEAGEPSYTIQMKDQCNNVITAQITESVGVAGSITVDDSQCPDNIVFEVQNPIDQVTYTWTLPDGSTANGTSVSYSTENTSGSVSLRANLGSCADETTTTTWDGVCEASLPQPVNWSHFNVQAINDKVKLEWSTEIEDSVNKFNVLHSADGRHWDMVITIPATGNTDKISNYYAYDNHPSKGINYYKIESVDYDGSLDHTPIQRIDMLVDDVEILLYPNPAKNYLNLDIPSDLSNNLYYSIYDLSNRLILSEVIDKAQTTIPTDRLKNGIYLVKVNTMEHSAISRHRITVIK